MDNIFISIDRQTDMLEYTTPKHLIKKKFHTPKKNVIYDMKLLHKVISQNVQLFA